MKNKSNFYYFGKCKHCGLDKALKNGYCIECEKKQPKCPNFFKDIFNGTLFDKEK